MEIWHIDLWISPNGVCYIERDIIEKLKSKDSFIFNSLGNKMKHYVSSPIENVRKLQILKKVKSQENMWELVFSLRKNEIRFLGCLAKESGVYKFYALSGFKKKDQDIKNKYIKITKSRISEFKSYYNPNGLQELL